MKFLEKVKAALGKPDASSAELKATLAAIDLEPDNAAVTVAQERRNELLVAGSENELDRADEQLRIVVRDRDRAVATRAELERRIALAEEVERAAALDADRAAVAAEALAVEKLLRDGWSEWQRNAVNLLGRLVEVEEKVQTLNVRLNATGRTDTLAPVEQRVFPVHPTLHGPAYSIALHTAFMTLPTVEGWGKSAPVRSDGKGF